MGVAEDCFPPEDEAENAGKCCDEGEGYSGDKEYAVLFGDADDFHEGDPGGDGVGQGDEGGPGEAEEEAVEDEGDADEDHGGGILHEEEAWSDDSFEGAEEFCEEADEAGGEFLGQFPLAEFGGEPGAVFSDGELDADDHEGEAKGNGGAGDGNGEQEGDAEEGHEDAKSAFLSGVDDHSEGEWLFLGGLEDAIERDGETQLVAFFGGDGAEGILHWGFGWFIGHGRLLQVNCVY